MGAAPVTDGYRPVPYWHDGATVPAGTDAPLPAEADVVVIGAGYTGLSAGWELARAGRHVVVVDRETIGWGASSRNGGMAHPGGKHEVDHLLALPRGRELYDITVEAFEGLEKLIAEVGIECDYRRSGHLYLAHHPRVVPSLQKSAQVYTDRLGQDARFVPAAELTAEIGTTAYHGGLVVELSGSLHPARYVAGLAAAALAAGVEVHEHTPVTALDGKRVVTDRGTITAGDVVVATNGYADAVVPWLRRRILSIGSYIIATEPLPPEQAADVSPKNRMFFDSRNFLNYWRLSPDGQRVLWGGRTSFAPTTVERSRDQLYRRMLAVHPQLEGVGIDRAWGGKVALTTDRFPHLGRHPDTGVVYSMGYCGTGVALSTHFGRVIGRWLAGGARDRLPAYADLPWAQVPAPGRVPSLLPFAGWWYQAMDRLGR